MNASIVPSLALLILGLFICIFIIEPNIKLYHITVSSEFHPVTEKLVDMGRLQEQDVHVLGYGKDRAERHMIEHIRAFLQRPDLSEQDIILFTAAKDSAQIRSYREIQRTFKEFHSPIVVCGTLSERIKKPERFPNIQGGCWIGRVWSLRAVYESSVSRESCLDMWSRAFAQFPGMIVVDEKARIFLHLGGIDRKQTQFDRFSRTFWLKGTDIKPLILNTEKADRTLLQTVIMRWREE